MLKSLTKKLSLLFGTTLVLTVLIVVLLLNINAQQRQTKIELDQVVELQLSVDMLRSQLWLFMQFYDEQSLHHVISAHSDLAAQLSTFENRDHRLDNMQRMSDGLSVVIAQESRIYSAQDTALPLASDLSSRELFQSRYSMIVQTMTEELAYVHRQVLDKSARELKALMWFAAGWMIIGSVVVCLISLHIFLRYRIGATEIKRAIVAVSKGDLDSKVSLKKMDSEFETIATFFNRMTSNLKETTVTKQELQREVERQTLQLKEKQKQLTFLSEHDTLTNLKNRRAFNAKLEDALQRARLQQHKLALLFIDLDKFKQINDTLGHDAGDCILVTVAHRLSHSFRDSDFVGRLGGDEFVVCLDLLDDFSCLDALIDELMHHLNQPIVFEGEAVRLDVSIGVSCFPDHAQDRTSLMRLADLAMYQAKGHRGPTWQLASHHLSIQPIAK